MQSPLSRLMYFPQRGHFPTLVTAFLLEQFRHRPPGVISPSGSPQLKQVSFSKTGENSLGGSAVGLSGGGSCGGRLNVPPQAMHSPKSRLMIFPQRGHVPTLVTGFFVL